MASQDGADAGGARAVSRERASRRTYSALMGILKELDRIQHLGALTAGELERLRNAVREILLAVIKRTFG